MPPGGTVEVKFVVTCVSGLRITTQTTGPEVRYGIYLCTDYYCDSWPNYVGQVEPNGTLVFKPESDTYWVVLNVPRRNCRVHSQNPHGPIRYSEGTSVDVTFQITCS
jgi:hypothetical protein